MQRTISMHSVGSRRLIQGFAVFLLAMAGNVAWAQLSGTGAISGTVQDPTGAIIPNATVTATNIDTNVPTTRTTTSAGDYNLSALIPGPIR